MNQEQEQIPIGYFSIHSKERELTEKYVLKLQALADEMLDRIKESNKMKTTEYFPILDASKAGNLLAIGALRHLFILGM
ncbi:Uncharacterized protein XB16_0178 [Leptospira santarosai]|uniref:Uncharacterized protein n=1 Tax=Leptospira santarosai TaxID=28183 RepID=A0A2P1QNQ7_9LEPT|nr:Uncharacterized protein XB16_0178 [Leptospira santarosai]